MNKKKRLALLCAIAILITVIPANSAQTTLKKSTPASVAESSGFEASIQGDPSVKSQFLEFQPGDAVEVTFTVQKDDGDAADFPAFTAELKNYGGIWGWDTPNAANCTVDVTGPGEYTFKTTATEKGNSERGAMWVSTILSKPPEGYTISGKSIKVADKIYDWHRAKLTIFNGDCRLSLWNMWSSEEENPLKYFPPAPEIDFEASIQGDPFAKSKFLDFQPGDAVEVTFTVQKDDGDAADFPAFTAELRNNGGIWGWEDTSNAANCTVDVTGPGEYTLKTTATEKGDSERGAMWVSADLTEPPEGYTISGKSIKVADKIYDWRRAELIKHKEVNDSDYRLSLWNIWGGEEENPLQYGKKIQVSRDGEFTLKDYIPWDVSSDTGAFFLQTNLKQLPTKYTILGKTIKIAGKEYDWSKAEASLYQDRVCLFVWNAQNNAAYANPIGRDMILHAGDEIEMTFTVIKKELPDNSKKEPGGDKNNSTTNQKPASLEKNKTFTSGSFKYKVTAAARKKSPAKVSVIRLSASGKKKSSISVKDIVSFGGFTYKVTAVSGGAFKEASKLTKAELGMGISSIPASAFKGCRKLSSVTAKAATQIGKGAFQNCTSLKKLILKKKVSVKKGALKGCKKTIKVTGGSRKINQANVKQLKKSGYKKLK